LTIYIHKFGSLVPALMALKALVAALAMALLLGEKIPPCSS